MCDAALSDSDYASFSSTKIFPIGSSNGATQCMNIKILDDNVLEANEYFTVTLGTIDSDLALGIAIGIITITDNDSELLSLIMHIMYLTYFYRGECVYSINAKH